MRSGSQRGVCVPGARGVAARRAGLTVLGMGLAGASVTRLAEEEPAPLSAFSLL